LQKGAQPTDVTAKLLKRAGVLEKLAQLKGQSPQPKE
jgi:ribosomal protein S16